MVIQGDIAKYLSGMPIMVAGCNIAVSQPTIRDICAYGEDKFLFSIEMIVHIERITSQIKMGNSVLENLNDFQVLIAVAKKDETIEQCFNLLFDLLFPDYICEIDNGSISFRKDEKGPMIGQINPMNFDNFQRTLKELFLPVNVSDSDEREFNPVNDKAAEIAKKLKKGRDKLAQMKQDGGDNKNHSIFGNFISALGVGLSMDVNVLYSYTPFQIYDTFNRMTSKMAFDLYQKVATTPMMDVSKMDEPKNWVDGLY